MKKVFTFVALTLGMISVANAQYSEPSKGDFAVEVGFTPFNTNSGEAFKLNEGMLKVRYFITDNDALRLKLGVGIDNQTETLSESSGEPSNKNYGYTMWESTSKRKNNFSDFSFMVGYERNLLTIGRFNVYAGLDLGYGMKKYSGSETSDMTSTTYDAKSIKQGSSETSQSRDYINQSTDKENKSMKYFNGNLFAGVDFFVWKNLYLGAECGLNFNTGKSPNAYYNTDYFSASYLANGSLNSSTKKVYDGSTNTTVTTTVNEGKTNTDTINGDISSNETSSTSFKLYVEPAIRIGWRF